MELMQRDNGRFDFGPVVVLNKIQAGDFVTVAAFCEAWWCKVLNVGINGLQRVFYAEVNNKLEYEHFHGYRRGDRILITERQVLRALLAN